MFRRICFVMLLLGMIGCRTQSGYQGEKVLVTNVDVLKIPDGIPSNAQVYFAGKPGHTFAFHKGPITEPGTFYFYDDTASQVMFMQSVSPEHQDLQPVKLDQSHDYRGFFVPGD